MKTPLFSLLAVAALVSVSLTACEKDKKGQLDPEAMISIRPATGVKAEAANPNHLSALEIVKQATDISFVYKGGVWARGFADFQRDTVNLRLKMWGTDIIDPNGNYHPKFIESQDMVLIKSYNYTADTLGYIPNKVLSTAQPLIKKAYDEGNWTECYRLFDEAFTFTPITGAEWCALKAQGKN